jgi:hypothetical protein
MSGKMGEGREGRPTAGDAPASAQLSTSIGTFAEEIEVAIHYTATILLKER